MRRKVALKVVGKTTPFIFDTSLLGLGAPWFQTGCAGLSVVPSRESSMHRSSQLCFVTKMHGFHVSHLRSRKIVPIPVSAGPPSASLWAFNSFRPCSRPRGISKAGSFECHGRGYITLIVVSRNCKEPGSFAVYCFESLSYMLCFG